MFLVCCISGTIHVYTSLSICLTLHDCIFKFSLGYYMCVLRLPRDMNTLFTCHAGWNPWFHERIVILRPLLIPRSNFPIWTEVPNLKWDRCLKSQSYMVVTLRVPFQLHVPNWWIFWKYVSIIISDGSSLYWSYILSLLPSFSVCLHR